MSMKKKDYEMVARTIKWAINGNRVEEGSDMYVIVHMLASAFEIGNPEFKRELFLTQCGIKEAAQE